MRYRPTRRPTGRPTGRPRRSPARRRVIAGAVAVLLSACSSDPVAPWPATEEGAGHWKTWVLADGSVLRPPAPPGASSSSTAAELDEIIALQRSRTPQLESTVRKWDTLPTTAWHETALEQLGFYWPLLPAVRVATPPRSARAFALLHVAMYDALVATWEAKYTYARRPPARADARVRALVPVSEVPSYPSEHAAAGEAAAAVLSYLFPDADTLAFHAMAREAGEARIAAGAAYRSDVEAGATIGRAVAERVVERATSDGASVPWSGSVPAGATMWRPTPPRYVQQPFDVLAGSWRTWVIPEGSAYRPAPPPVPGSPAFETALDELRHFSTSRTIEQADIARYWATESPSSRWEVFMQEEVDRRRLTPVHAARALALASVATYDAMVACWEAKFTYWLERPISADPALKTVFATPPFPSYPSGHSTLSAAAGEVFAELFPDAATTYRNKADEASQSRVYAGVHYRFDVVAGEELGRKVGAAVVAWSRADGSHR